MWSGRLGYCGHLGLHSVAVAEDRHTLTACMRLMSGMCSGLTDCSHDRFLKVCAFGEGVMQCRRAGRVGHAWPIRRCHGVVYGSARLCR